MSQHDNRTRSCGEDLPSPRSFHLPLLTPLIFVADVSAHFENGRLLLVSLNTDMMCANVIGVVLERAQRPWKCSRYIKNKPYIKSRYCRGVDVIIVINTIAGISQQMHHHLARVLEEKARPRSSSA